MKYEWIMQKTKAKRNELDHCMRWLRFGKMIATAKATRGFIVTVLNYNTFQSLENYKSDSKSDTKSDLKAKQKRYESDMKATLLYKNDNNGKNGINEKKKYMDVVLLTEDEYKKLIDKFGEDIAKDKIEELNNSIMSKGYKYKSHYHTILCWDRKNKKEGANKNKAIPLEERMKIFNKVKKGDDKNEIN